LINIGRITRFAAGAILALAVSYSAFAQSRIVGDVNNGERVRITGTTSPLISRSTETARLPGEKQLGRMILTLAPSAAQEQAAKKLVADIHNPASPNFHKWLTPAQFGNQFGLSEQDATRVRQWLETQGLTVHEVANSRRFIVFSGNVQQVEQAFSTEMHSYTYKGKEFIANASEIKIPAALAPIVKGVVRLHSEPNKPQTFVGGKVHRNPKTGQFEGGSGDHYLTPADFATIYNLNPLYKAGIDGTGQKIAIVGRSNIDVTNVTSFRSLLGLPVNDPTVIVNGDDPGEVTNDMPEAMLDVTWSGAVAPMAKVTLVVSQSNFSDGVDVSASYIVDHNIAPVMSTSFGQCESILGPIGNAFYFSLWQQAAAEGITAFVSAGDNGGAGCDEPGAGQYAFGGLAVSGIASTPYNVAVGGTQFEDTTDPTKYWATTNDPVTGASALSYIPEMVWNESSNDPTYPSLWSGSGGVSSIYAKPDWQSAPGVPADGMRDLPDVSLTASVHDGYLACMFGNCAFGEYFYYFGGTSASSPATAGIMALVNQKLGGQPQGMANYVFYRLASTPGVYHDTVDGNNKVPDASGLYTVGYDAGPGYDVASGLGSFDANALVNNWASASAGTASSMTLALAPGSPTTAVHGTPIGFVATVKCSGTGCTAPGGDVALIATSGTSSLGLGAGALTASSTGSVATIAATRIPGGSYNVAGHYNGDGKYLNSNSNSVLVTITPEPSQTLVGALGGGVLTTSPISISYGEPLLVGAIVAGNSGAGYPSGNLSMTVDGAPATTISFNPGTGAVTASNLTLNYGENSGIIAPGINTISQSSTISYLPAYVDGWTQRFPAGSHVMQVNYPGDASFGASASNAFTFNITKADIFFGDFFALGSIVANVPVHFEGQLGFSNGGFANFTGTITITDTTTGTPVVVGSGPVSMAYGGSFDVPVTFTVVGNHVLKVAFSGDHDTNPAFSIFNAVPVNANLPPYVILGADVASAVVGAPVTLTAQVQSDLRNYIPTGAVTFFDGTTSLGTATLDSTGTGTLVVTTLGAGTHTNITANYSGDVYLTSAVGGPITELIADYTVQAPSAALTIAAGQSGTATLSVIPLGGSTQTVSFACGTLPANITCSFSPTSVTLDGTNPGTVTVTVNTGTTTAKSGTNGYLLGAASTLAFGLFLIPMGKRKRLQSLLGLAAIVVITMVGIGCGGSSSTKPPVTNTGIAVPGTYVLNITATGATGTTAKTTPLVVTVQ